MARDVEGPITHAVLAGKVRASGQQLLHSLGAARPGQKRTCSKGPGVVADHHRVVEW
jgi:hypothetical protein